MARYGKKAQSKVKRAMHERKRGTLKSGRSGKKVKSRKQAIAIGLSEARRAGAKAAQKVERAMHEMKRGELRSGRSGKKVTSREQAIAIGLSEARRAGGKVPRPRRSASK